MIIFVIVILFAVFGTLSLTNNMNTSAGDILYVFIGYLICAPVFIIMSLFNGDSTN